MFIVNEKANKNKVRDKNSNVATAAVDFWHVANIIDFTSASSLSRTGTLVISATSLVVRCRYDISIHGSQRWRRIRRHFAPFSGIVAGASGVVRLLLACDGHCFGPPELVHKPRSG